MFNRISKNNSESVHVELSLLSCLTTTEIYFKPKLYSYIICLVYVVMQLYMHFAEKKILEKVKVMIHICFILCIYVTNIYTYI